MQDVTRGGGGKGVRIVDTIETEQNFLGKNRSPEKTLPRP